MLAQEYSVLLSECKSLDLEVGKERHVGQEQLEASCDVRLAVHEVETCVASAVIEESDTVAVLGSRRRERSHDVGVDDLADVVCPWGSLR
jgi:hypothetical protein